MDDSTNNSITEKITEDDRQFCEDEIPFWKRIVEIGKQVPIEEWNKLPKDFARNAEHYMYGAPKDEDS
jgi:hypothetical protein